MRYETFSNVVLDTQTICGMQWTVRTDVQTKLEIEHASVGLAHARLISVSVHALHTSTITYICTSHVYIYKGGGGGAAVSCS